MATPKKTAALRSNQRLPRLSAELKAVYAQSPTPARRVLMQLRKLIYATAGSDPRIGALEETLKWGEPAFLTPMTKSGTTVRCAWKPKAPADVGLYFNCQTSLIETFRTLYAKELRFEGNRAIKLAIAQPLPEEALARVIHAALTYHLKS